MIRYESLTKAYGKSVVLDSLSLNIERGEIFCLLGPNGAGKTTSLMTLATVIRPTAGTIYVDDFDVRKHPELVRQIIGIAFQETALDSRLTIDQTLEFHGRACGLETGALHKRAKDTLYYLYLWSDRHKKVSRISMGMKKKLEDAKLLVQRPKVAVFDEPTAFLDPTSRLRIWKRIQDLKNEGSTILIATNVMDEADKLAERVGILYKGKLIACGSPSTLRESVSTEEVLEIRVAGSIEDAERLATRILGISSVVPVRNLNALRLYASNSEELMPEVIRAFQSGGVKVLGVSFSTPSLDDVFLHYTGEKL